MKKKKFVVLGLGIFGSTLARDLYNYGHDVIAIDNIMPNVERMSTEISDVLCLDFTDLEQLKKAGIADCDVGIITTGSKLEDAILGTLNLKELGINEIIVKAKNTVNAEILKKIGATTTISPEKDAAKHTAKKLSVGNVVDVFDIDKNYSIYETVVDEKWDGLSMIDLQLRSKYNVNVIGIRRDEVLTPNFSPNDKFKKGDEVLFVTDSEGFKKIYNLKK